MKKFTQITVALLLLVALLSGCRLTNNNETTAPIKESTSQTEPAGTTQATTAPTQGEMTLPSILESMPDSIPTT